MDISLAKTFLAVVETGSFVTAADQVFVTQSTVSARIKTLEDLLGKALFVRGKQGAIMTPAGQQFQRHAQMMVRIWEHARLEVALPEGYHTALNIGGQYSLWDGYLLQWLAKIRKSPSEIAVRAQMGFSESLMENLVNGIIDLGVMYTPQSRPGFEIELLFRDELILVSQEGGSGFPDKSYVYIDWGPEFMADHALNFSEKSTPGTFLELGSLSLQYLIESKASGYVPRRLVKTHLATGQLHQVKEVPVFSYPAYVVYPSETDYMAEVLTGLRATAKENGLV